MSANSDKIKDLIDKIRIVRNRAELEMLLSEVKAAASQRPVRLAFVNAHAINLCYANEDFMDHLTACDYLLRDGAGMKILFKILKKEAGLNLNGTDLIPRIIQYYQGESVALLGTDSPYLEASRDRIAEMGARPVLLMDGFQESWRYPGALQEVPASLVILAMGMPKQEHVAALIADKASVPSLIICGGAILDFMGGKVTRAPEIFRKTGMEWLYRLMQEPRRLFGRYIIGNFLFLFRAISLPFDKAQTVDKNIPAKKEEPRKILHIVRQYHPSIGGLESYVRSMTAHQRAMGYDCEILTLNRIFHGDSANLPEHEIINGIRVRRVPFSGKRRFFFPKMDASYLSQFDIIHVHNTDMFYDYVGILGIFKKIPAFATTHGGFFHTKDFSLIKKIYFNVITRFTSLGYKALFAISQNDYDTFKGLNENVLLFPNAIEPLGDEISQGNDFIYIGRMAAHKNIDRMIEVYAELKHRHGVAGLLHVVGPEWDISIEDMKTIARKCKVEDSVIFHGPATREDMQEISRKCGYFLSASSFEGFGMSMLEVMSVGLIPFVHDNESFRELIGRSKIGLVTNFELVEKAARDIAIRLKGTEEEQRRKARDFALGFSWEKLANDTVKAYRKFAR